MALLFLFFLLKDPYAPDGEGVLQRSRIPVIAVLNIGLNYT